MTESLDRIGEEPIVQRRPEKYGYVLPFEDDEGASFSPIQLASVVLRYRKLVLTATVATGVAALVLSLLFRRQYAESSFAPLSTEANASQLAGLAAQFGVNLGGLSGGESVDFYASLLESRALLGAAALNEYRFPTDEDARDTLIGNLLQLYNVNGDTPQEKLQRAIKQLDKDVDVTKDADAGVVTLDVKAKWPALAELVNRRLLSLVNDFNLHKRQSQAVAERRFVEGRLQDARAELDSAEREQARFLEANRTYQDSPRLRVEAGRLQRRVDFVQQVYTTLSQAYEQARIDEVRNTPVITIIDEPEGSARHTGILALNILVGLVLGAVAGVAYAFGKDYMTRERVVHVPAYQEFAQLRGHALADLKHLPMIPLRLLQKLLGKSP